MMQTLAEADDTGLQGQVAIVTGGGAALSHFHRTGVSYG